jgi:Predicted transcriptional regulators
MADRLLTLREIGQQIRDLRESLGYTNAAEFAAYVGWSPQQLSNYEKGHKRPEITMANKLCVRTRVTLDYIYRDDHTGLPLHVANAIQDYRSRQKPSPAEEAAKA